MDSATAIRRGMSMNHLNPSSPQISLELPAAGLEYDVDRRTRDHEERDELRTARGILIAVGLSACMWLIVLAAVVFF
jgi:hypothetical protein